MDKIAAKIKHVWRKVSCLLASGGLQALAALLGPRPAFLPIPVRIERIVRYK